MTHRLLVKLNDNIKDRNINLQREFRLEDDEGDGFVPFYAFRNVIQKINKGIPKSDYLKLDNKYKSDREGKQAYDYQKFISDVMNVRKYETTLAKLFDKIKEQMQMGKPDLFKLIENYDDRGRGFIDINDLTTCFDRLSIRLKREYSDAIKFCFESEDTGRIEYSYLEKEFVQYLDNLGLEYEDLLTNQAQEDEVDKYWSRPIFLEFYKYFSKNQVLSIKKFFKDDYGMGPKGFISNYQFQDLLEKIAPNLDSNETNRFLSDITDPDSKRISVNKFITIYDEMAASFDENELNAINAEQGDLLHENKVLYKLMQAIEAQGSDFKSYFSQYEFQRQMLTISKKDFYVACGDLEIEESDIQYDDIVKLFDTGKAATLDLTPLSTFIKDYQKDIPFFIEHKKFTRQREFLEEFIPYAMEIRRAEQVPKLLIQEDMDGNGLMDIQVFLRHLSYLDLGIKNSNDHRLLLEKYDTFKQEEINIVEFCLDFETILKEFYPDARNSLDGVSNEIQSLVERVGASIIHNHETIDAWITSLRSKQHRSKIPLNSLCCKLKEEYPKINQDEIVSIIKALDRKRKGFVLDFRLKSFFTEYNEEGCHPGIVKFIEILKRKRMSLADFLNPILESSGSMTYKDLQEHLEKEISRGGQKTFEKEYRSMLIFLNLKRESIDLVELQMKLKSSCLSYNLLEGREIDAYIMGRGEIEEKMLGLQGTELASLVGILEKVNKALHVRKLTFEEQFGDGKTLKKRSFRARMQDLGVTSHLRYSELVEAIKVKKTFDTVDLEKFKKMVKSLESTGPKGPRDYKQLKEYVQELKEHIREYDINVGRMFARCDQDNSDDISPREFYILISQIRPDINRRDVAGIFEMLDKDGNGSLSKMEFEKVFSVSMRDRVSSRVKQMSWASPIFAEISYVLHLQLRTARESLSRNLQKGGAIPRPTFRVFLNDLDLATLDSAQKTRKFENGLKLDSKDAMNEDIDFYLFKQCLEEYESLEDQTQAYHDDASKIFSLIAKNFNYNVDKIVYIFDMQDDGKVTIHEFKAVCNNIIPRDTKSGGDQFLDKNSMELAFSSLTIEDQKSGEVPTTEFKKFFTNFIENMKTEITRKISTFIMQNYEEIVKDCEDKEIRERTSDQKGYVSKGTFSRILEDRGYAPTEKELKSLQKFYPLYCKQDRVYYAELFEELLKSQNNQKSVKKHRHKDKNFREVLETVKRRLDYDPGLLMDEFMTLDQNDDEMVELGGLLEIIEEIYGAQLSRAIETQFYQKLLCLKTDMINYRRVVTLVFTGKTNMRDQYEMMNHAMVSEFAEEIKQELKLRKIPSHEFFKYFDVDKDGNITIDEFVRETQDICINYSGKELSQIHNEILSNYCTRKKKIFSLNIFRKMLYGYQLEDCRPLVNHLRAELSYRGKSANRFFFQNDRVKDKHLTFEEFYNAVKRLDSQIEVADADILFIHFDLDKNGSISLAEFTEQLSQKSYLNEFSQELNQYLRSHNYTIDELVSIYSAKSSKNGQRGYKEERHKSSSKLDLRNKMKSNRLPPSSYLTKTQFSTMGQQFLRKNLAKPEILGKIFEEIDENTDNFVSVGELEYLFDRGVKETFNQNLGKLRLEILEDLTRRRVGLRDFFKEIASQRKKKRTHQNLEKKLGTFWEIEELSRCLMTLDIQLEQKQEDLMFELLDSDKDGVIGEQEFFKAILGDKSKVRSLSRTVRRVLKQDKVSIKKLARQIDIDGDTNIDFKEFSEFIDEMRLNFSYKDIVTLFEYADQDGSGKVDSKEIMQIFDPKKIVEKKHPNNMVVLREDLENCKIWDSKWHKMDPADKGMTPTKFVKFLGEIKSRLEKFEGYEVFHKLDFKQKENLKIYDIEDFLEDSKNNSVNVADQEAKNQNKDNLEELRDSFAYQNLDGHGIFKQLDFNNDGLIPKRNFEEILKTNKILRGNPKAIRQMVHFYQQPHTILVDYNKLFKDMKELKPGKPLFSYFLAGDILAMGHNLRRNVKELFLGQEAETGDLDGKMSIGEFGQFVSRTWGESQKITMEKPSKQPKRGERRKKGVVIRRQDDDPTRGEISDLFFYLKSANQDDDQSKVDREGGEESKTVNFPKFYQNPQNSKEDLTFYEFLRLFDRETRKKELHFILKDHEALLNDIKLSMLKANQTSIWRYLRRQEDKRNFVLECEKMSFVLKNHSVGEIKKLADELEQPSRKGFVSLPLLSLALEEVDLDENQMRRIKEEFVVARTSDQDNFQRHSILKDNNTRRKKNTFVVGGKEFTPTEIKHVKQLVTDINDFIKEDGLEYRPFFAMRDSAKEGLISYEDFDDLLYNELDVELDDPSIAKSLKLTKQFGTVEQRDDMIDYMKLKDLIDGKLDKNVIFEVQQEEANNLERNAEIQKSEAEEAVQEDPKKKEQARELLDSICKFYKRRTLTPSRFFAKFTKNGDNVTKQNFTSILVKEIDGVSEVNSNSLFEYLLNQQKSSTGQNLQNLGKEFFLQKFKSATVDLTPIKMEGGFEDQVDQVFTLVDINQNEAINRQELKLGCKKLGLNLNEEEVNNLFESFKEQDGAQTLNKQEFTSLIGYKFRTDLVKPATVLDRLKTEIQIVDVSGSGFLNGNQLVNLFNRMGLEPKEDEIQGIIDEIGDEITQEVYEDKLIQSVIKKDQKFKSEGMNKAMIKIRGAFSPSLGGFINSFQNMPENYFLSFTQQLFLLGENLPTAGLCPELSSSSFYYTNLFPPLKTSSLNSSKNEKYAHLPEFTDERLSSNVRVTVPSLMAKIQISRAIGIPLPKKEILSNVKICSRFLRVVLLRNKKYLANLVEIPARYNPSYEDRWYFDKLHNQVVKTDLNSHKNDKLSTVAMFSQQKNSNCIIIKKNEFNLSKDVGLELVFELVMTVKHKDCKHEIMMSNGYAKVKVNDLQKQNSFKLDVQGGDPVENELRINNEEIRKGRHGFVAKVASLFEGDVSPKIEFSVNRKFSLAEKKQIGVLPEICLVGLNDLQQFSLFRQVAGYEAFQFANSTNTDVHTYVPIKTFSQLFNISTVKCLWAQFYKESIHPLVKDYMIDEYSKIFKVMMQKIFLMLSDTNFHFSKEFQTRNYWGSPMIQRKRIKLCKQHFREIFRAVQIQVKIIDNKKRVNRKYKVQEPKFPKSLQLIMSEKITKEGQKIKPKQKAFDVMDLLIDHEEEDDGFGNIAFQGDLENNCNVLKWK